MTARGENLNDLGAAETFIAQGFGELGEGSDRNASEHRSARAARIDDENKLAAKFVFRRRLDKHGSKHTHSPHWSIRQRVRGPLNFLGFKNKSALTLNELTR